MVSWLTFNQLAVLTAQLDLLAKYKSAWEYKSTLQDNLSLGWLRESAEGAQASDNNESGRTPESTTDNGDMNACQAFLRLEFMWHRGTWVGFLCRQFGHICGSAWALNRGLRGSGQDVEGFGTCTIDS